MHVGKILSELRKQRRRIDRAIVVLEMLKQQPGQRKHKTHQRKSKAGTEISRRIRRMAGEKKKLATEEVATRATVIPFERLRRHA
jgi:hypothetical protein